MPHDPFYQKLLDEAAAQRVPRAARSLPSRAPDPVSNVPVRPAPTDDALRAATVWALADYARADGFDHYAALPYLRAMLDEDYGHDGEKSVVLYFLSNARTWRGPVARAVEAELRRRFA